MGHYTLSTRCTVFGDDFNHSHSKRIVLKVKCLKFGELLCPLFDRHLSKFVAVEKQELELSKLQKVKKTESNKC